MIHEQQVEELQFRLRDLEHRLEQSPIQPVHDPTLEKIVVAVRRLAIVRQDGGHKEVAKAARYAASCLLAWADRVEGTPGAANAIDYSLTRFLSRAA